MATAAGAAANVRTASAKKPTATNRIIPTVPQNSVPLCFQGTAGYQKVIVLQMSEGVQEYHDGQHDEVNTGDLSNERSAILNGPGATVGNGHTEHHLEEF